MLFGLVKGAFRTVLFGAVLVAAGGGYGYYKVAGRRLVVGEGAVVTVGVVRPTGSLTGGTLPLTFEAYVKDPSGHNFLVPDKEGIGLVRARYEWTHGRFEWIPDVGFAERQAESAAERRKIAGKDMSGLIKRLRSDDIVVREVSSKELKIRTGQTLGYAYDLPKPERDKAAEAWEKWWAVDDNRMRYGAQRSVDGAQDVLDTLRRALGPTPREEAPRK